MKAKEYKQSGKHIYMTKCPIVGIQSALLIMDGRYEEAMQNYVGLVGYIRVYDVQSKTKIQLGLRLFNN